MPKSNSIRKGYRIAVVANLIARVLSRVGHILLAVLGPGVYFLGLFNTIVNIGFEAQDKPLPQKIAYGLLSAGLLAAAIAIFVVAAPIWGPIFTIFSLVVNTIFAFKNMFKAIFHRMTLPANATILEKRLANTAIIQQAINAVTTLVSVVALGLLLFFPPVAMAAGIVLAICSAIAIINHISMLFSAKEKQDIKELISEPEPSKSESLSDRDSEESNYHLLHHSFEDIDSQLPNQHRSMSTERSADIDPTHLAVSETVSLIEDSDRSRAPSPTGSSPISPRSERIESEPESSPTPTVPKLRP